AMSRICFDGLNLSLVQGTGIATYTRMLMRIAHDLGHEIGAVYSTRQAPSKNPLLNEITFFDAQMRKPRGFAGAWQGFKEHLQIRPSVRPVGVDFSGLVIKRPFEEKLKAHDRIYIARNLFMSARNFFGLTKRFVTLTFDQAPDIFHCTYQLPLRAKSA